jgi:hypothetical protein
MKKLTKILSLAALGAGLFFTPVQKSSAQIYGFLGVNPITETATDYSVSITHVPDFIRDVPAHPDDLFKTRPQDITPIDDCSFSLPIVGRKNVLEMKAGIGIKKGVFDFRFGPKINYGWGNEKSIIKERNYLNHPGTDTRGTGAALTYDQFKVSRNTGLNFGGIAEATLAFDLSRGYEVFFLGPFAEYSFSILPQKFYFENGWDRYNTLEKKSTYELASDMLNQSIKLGVKASLGPIALSLYGGVDFLDLLNQTDLAKESNLLINANQRFFCGVTFGMGVDSIMFTKGFF